MVTTRSGVCVDRRRPAPLFVGMSEAWRWRRAFDVKVTIVRPGGYRTGLYTSPATGTPLPAYIRTIDGTLPPRLPKTRGDAP